MDGLLRQRRLRVHGQLPLRRRAAALRPRLPGPDREPRRRALPGAVGHRRRSGDRRRRSRERRIPTTPTSPRSSTRRTARRPSTRTRPTGRSPGRRRWTSPTRRAAAARACSCSRTPSSDLEDAFEKNIPFALDVAESADDPANPESHLGREAPDFQIQPFAVSYGDPQTVEINAKRELGPLTVHWKVNGGATQSAATVRVRGRRALRRATRTSTTTTSAARSPAPPRRQRPRLVRGRRRASQSFTYEVRSDTGNACSSSRRRTTPARATAPRTRAPPGRSSTTTTRRRWPRTGSTSTSTTSTPRAAGRPIRSASSATTTRSSGTRATTCSPAGRARGRAPASRVSRTT